jgi:hypothetical protein
MKYFNKIDLPIFESLSNELNNLIDSKKISWGTTGQISLTTIKGKEDDYLIGTGSLTHDWNNSYITQDGNPTIIVTKKESPLSEKDFTVLCSQFAGTQFESLYTLLSNTFTLGRVRLMQLSPKSCYSWHVDNSKRLHYVINTYPGCFMLIDEEVKHLDQNTWWMTDTTKFHTAFNSSLKSRVHLVASVF